MSQNILQYESKVWSTADLLIGAGIKQSDFPKYMMPYFALMMLESRLIRHSRKTLKDLGKDSIDDLENINDFLEEFKKGRKSSVNRHFSFYVISAFLCEEAINKKGFKDVLKLVYSGENGELFFENLKSILNVDETNFHETIVRLIV